MRFSHRAKFVRYVAAYLVVVAILLAAFAFFDSQCFADSSSDAEAELWKEIDDGLNNIDFSDFDAVGIDVVGSVADKIRDIANGKYDAADSFWQFALSAFLGELAKIVPTVIGIFAVIVVAGLARRTSKTTFSEGTNGIIGFVASVLVSVYIIYVLSRAYLQVFGTVAQIKALCDAFSPIAVTLLIALGANTTASICNPSLITFSSLVISIVNAFILPTSLFALIFSVASNLSDNVKVEKTSKFCSGLCGWTLGVIFMIFSASTTVQGISAAKADGISVRIAKFASKSYVPIVGGYFADGFDMVLASGSLIKNAFGLVALLVLIVKIIKPIVLLLALKLAFSAVSAFTEPFADEKQIKLLDGVSASLSLPIAVLVAVAFMFAVVVTVVMSCSVV